MVDDSAATTGAPTGHRARPPGRAHHVGAPAPVEHAVDEGALTEAMDELATALSGPFSAEHVLSRLAAAAVRVLDVDGAGTMVAADDRLLRFAYASGPRRDRVCDLEMHQQETQSGPCHDTFLSGEVIDIADLAVEGNWSAFQRRAVEIGLPGVTALPLRARGRSWGVLDLYRMERRRLSRRELEAARSLATLATACLVVTADREAAEAARAELSRRAMHDPLTDLPVRWVLLEQLGHALTRLERHPGHLAVLFLDLDGLKYVNDTYGHAVGDELLVAFARRVQTVLRPSDLVARVGGDEFVVVLEDLGGACAAEEVAQRVMLELAEPHRVDGRAMQPSASIGVAVTEDAAEAPERLIAHADSAMYQAKRGGRGLVAVFDAAGYESERAEATGTAQLLPALRAALAHGELELHYQPVVGLSPGGRAEQDGRAEHGWTEHGWPEHGGPGTEDARLPGRLHAVEALLRWRRPGHGLVLAEEFIGPAETSGLVVDLGAWVLRTACEQLAVWDADLGGGAPRRVLVNVAAAELLSPDLVGRVAAALGASGVAADRLTLEVTETGLLGDPEVVASTVAELRALGCHLAIDDFGTGYSSLSRLVQLPARTLKVDRSFTADLQGSPAARAVVAAVLQLGTGLGREVVVEGVEDEATLDTLRDLGATFVQGFHVGRPQPGDALAALLRRDR